MTKGPKWVADTHTLLTATRSLLYSRIEYGVTTHTASNNTRVKELQIHENKALKISTHSIPNTQMNTLSQQTSQLTLLQRRNKNILKLYDNRTQYGNIILRINLL